MRRRLGRLSGVTGRSDISAAQRLGAALGVGRQEGCGLWSDSARSQPYLGLQRAASSLASQPNGERADGGRGGTWAVAGARGRGTRKSTAAEAVSARLAAWAGGLLSPWILPARAWERWAPEARAGMGGAVLPVLPQFPLPKV